MPVEINDILNITGAKVPYAPEQFTVDSFIEATLPSDLIGFMQFFGLGDYNRKLSLLSPIEWRVDRHSRLTEQSRIQGDWLAEDAVSGVHFASTADGDRLIATGNESCRIVLNCRVYGGFLKVGSTFSEALQQIFFPRHWDVLRATRVFFNSAANRDFLLTLSANTSLSRIESALSEFVFAITFENEDERCFFDSEHGVLISLSNVSRWGAGSEVIVTVGPVCDGAFLASLESSLNSLGFSFGGAL